MYIKNLFLGLLWLMCCTSVYATCPETNIAAALESKDITVLEELAIALTDCEQWQDSLGQVYHRLGVSYYLQDDNAKAILNTEKAIEVWEELYVQAPFGKLGLCYYNLGIFHMEKLRYYEAQQALERGLKVYQEVGDKEWEYNMLLGLTEVYTFFGDYEKSETALQYIIHDATEAHEYSRAEAYLNLSNMYLEQKKYAEVLPLANKAAPVFEAYEDLENYGGVMHNSAIAYDKLGEQEEAIRRAKKARKNYELLKRSYDLASIDNVLATFYIHQKQYDLAAAQLDEALKVCEANDYPNLKAIVYDNYGEVYFAQKDYSAALIAFEKSIFCHLPEVAQNRILTDNLRARIAEISTKYNLFIATYDYAWAALAAYAGNNDPATLHKAMDYLKIGDATVDQLRYDHSSQDTKLFWRERVLPFYEQAIAICYALDDANQAFYFLEKSKSVLLLEALLGSKAQDALPDSLRQRLQFIRKKVGRERENLAYLPDSLKAETLAELVALGKKQEELEERITVAYPQYRNILEESEPMSQENFQINYLQQAETTFIHYFWGEEKVYALRQKGNSASFLELGDSPELTQDVQAFLTYFTAANQITNAPADFLAKAYLLYQRLIAPLELEETDQLLIVPDGLLAYLPFEALITTAATNLNEATYLLQEHPLHYAFSATLLDQMSKTTRGNSEGVLAMAPFAGRADADYAELAYSGKELETIGQFFTTDTYLDEAATRADFLKGQQRYGVLHLSTHAFSSVEAERARIVFADSTLYLSDLYQLQVPAELVVLSACQSNIGQLVKGEGVLGLGRGFCYAGAKSIVASLWNLNDKYTSSIIGSFYQSLASGSSKPEALRQAKLSFLGDPELAAFQKSPYYWAGLTYYGGDEPIGVSSQHPLMKYLRIGQFVLLLLFGSLLATRLLRRRG